MEERYSRQQLFKPIGSKGQEKIQNKQVLIVGVGALGSASAESLVRAGVGKLTIIDRDYVEWSNLQRQQLYSEQDVNEKIPKAIAAKNRLEQINSEVQIDAFVMDANAENMEHLLENVDVIIDATDNFDIRFIINDLSQKHNIPWIYGSCVGSYGMSYTIISQKTPCLHCVLKDFPFTGITCDTAGIISPAVQFVAAYQVAEALKILVEDFAAIRKNFFMFDIWNNQHHFIKLGKIKTDDCPSCGLNRTYPYLSYEKQTKIAVLCGRNTVQIRSVDNRQYNFDDIEKVLKKLGKVERNPYLLSCELDDYRVVIFQDGRVFIHGTHEITKAKQLYYRLFG
ncbi:TPA: molybdopterin-synthase adenylyltransferase MoeB [Bacillus cereus]